MVVATRMVELSRKPRLLDTSDRDSTSRKDELILLPSLI